MSRKLYNFLSGSIGSALSDSDTQVDLGTSIPIDLDVGEYVPLVLDPEGDAEIVHLVDYDPGQGTGTIERGKEETAPHAHGANTPWACVPLVADAFAGVGYVRHGSDGDRLRPYGFDLVIWRGEAEPLNLIDGDIWIERA